MALEPMLLEGVPLIREGLPLLGEPDCVCCEDAPCVSPCIITIDVTDNDNCNYTLTGQASNCQGASVVEWNWELPGGGTDSGQSTTVTIPQDGQYYQVRLNVVDSDGCEKSTFTELRCDPDLGVHDCDPCRPNGAPDEVVVMLSPDLIATCNDVQNTCEFAGQSFTLSFFDNGTETCEWRGNFPYTQPSCVGAVLEIKLTGRQPTGPDPSNLILNVGHSGDVPGGFGTVPASGTSVWRGFTNDCVGSTTLAISSVIAGNACGPSVVNPTPCSVSF